jgi:hypothetical protein
VLGAVSRLLYCCRFLHNFIILLTFERRWIAIFASTSLIIVVSENFRAKTVQDMAMTR